MPRYFYTAKSFSGEERSGTLEAKDTHELSRLLHQEGYILISADLQEEAIKKKFSLGDIFGIFRGVSLTEKMIFTRNLQVMISAGVPLPRALKMLSGQARNKKFKQALLKIEEEIIKGENFSQALSKHPDIFSELFFSMVKVGEESGTLVDVLKNLTNQMEREYELRSKITSALIYPAVIISAMIGIGILMLIVVVPKLAETFEELKIELPPTTKMVIFIGTFLAKYWFLLPLILLVLFFFFRVILKTKGGKRRMDSLVLKLPIISPLVKKTNSAYTARTLSNLITSGVPIVRSLEILSEAIGNFYYKKALSEAAEKVSKGMKLAEALSSYQDLYSPLVSQMIEVGEETGETSAILAKLADFFEEEVGNATKNLAAVIEPVLMIIIGAVVGFFAVSMIQPMYSMLGAIK